MSCGHYGGSDGISVFTATGDGSLDPPAHFALETDGDEFAGLSQVLAAVHLNDDDLLDLVAAPGTTFLGRAAAANRPPTAFAWEYQPPWDGYIRLASQAADPDYHAHDVQLDVRVGRSRRRGPQADVHRAVAGEQRTR